MPKLQTQVQDEVDSLPRTEMPQEAPTTDLTSGSKQGKSVAGKVLPGNISTKAPPKMNMSLDASRQAHDYLANLPDDDDDFDQMFGDLEPQPPVESIDVATTSTLPSLEMAGAPEWYQVGNLPGQARNAIRKIGDAVFKQFTTTPTDKIVTLSTITNDPEEVGAVFSFIKKHGQKVNSADIDFEKSMPGYKAQVEMWRCNGFEFQLVKDFAGYYIYGWDEDTSKLAGPKSTDTLIEEVKLLGKHIAEICWTEQHRKLTETEKGIMSAYQDLLDEAVVDLVEAGLSDIQISKLIEGEDDQTLEEEQDEDDEWNDEHWNDSSK